MEGYLTLDFVTFSNVFINLLMCNTYLCGLALETFTCTGSSTFNIVFYRQRTRGKNLFDYLYRNKSKGSI
jgi:hypothetical protein